MTNMSRLIYSVYSTLMGSLALVLLLGGCVAKAKKLPEYPVHPLSSYPYSQVQDGLAVTIEPLTNPQESENIFGTDLLSRGIFAVYVSVENQGAPSTFILLTERFTLQTGQREEHPVFDPAQVKSTTLESVQRATGGFGAVLSAATMCMMLGLPGYPFIWASDAIQKQEAEVRHKFWVEALQPGPLGAAQPKTISSGEETHGFVYFPRPPGEPGPGHWVLHLEAQDINSKEVKVFDFILHEQ